MQNLLMLRKLWQSESCSRRRMLLLTQSAFAATTLTSLLTPASAQTGDQPDWRFCNKCLGMFYNGAPDKGHCSAGGGHVPQGFLFSLHYDGNQAGTNQLQYAWRFCEKCRVLFYDGSPNKGRCPADGQGHRAQGLMFGLDLKPPAGHQSQPDWRFCNKCNVLFWDGTTAKGHCPVGGGHTAQGFNFNLIYKNAFTDPGRAISDVLQGLVESNRGEFERNIKSLLGRGDLIGRGISLYDINFRLGVPDFRYNNNRFNYRLNNNYLYFKSTTPTVFGSYADPAFEVHFDSLLTAGVAVSAQGRPHVDRVVASIPQVTVSPRNVSGGVVTTVVRFFQLTETGGHTIQQAHDKYLNFDLTDRINAYLARF